MRADRPMLATSALNQGELLVAHPRSHVTESPFGYLLRISEGNGCPTPTWILQHVGLTYLEINSGIYPIHHLVDAVGGPAETIENIAWRRVGRSTMRRLDQVLIPRQLRMARVSFCPGCVKDRQIAEVHWDVKAVMACPIHGTELLSVCPGCRQPLTWRRQGLLICSCGMALDVDIETLAPSEVCELAAIVAEKFHIPVPFHHGAGLPTQLREMPLQALLVVLMKVGRLAQLSRGETKNASPEDVMRSATSVLKEWPVCFHKMLSDLEQAQVGTVGQGIRFIATVKHQLVESLLKCGVQDSEITFLREAVEGYVQSSSLLASTRRSLSRLNKDQIRSALEGFEPIRRSKSTNSLQ